MRIFRTVSDLQNYLDEISKIAHETGQPVFLTKDGRVDMVLMSIETYKAMLTADGRRSRTHSCWKKPNGAWLKTLSQPRRMKMC